MLIKKLKNNNFFLRLCKNVRIKILEMLYHAKSGHPGPSLSIVEILVYLYFFQIKFEKNKRLDKFILSKGHAAPALYAVLMEMGLLKNDTLCLRKINSKLQGHPDKNFLKEIDFSTGALGQGLSIACGFDIANTFLKNKSKTYCILGDGELQEGQIWEASMYIGSHRLKNICTIIDENKFQNELETKKTLNMGNIKEKFKAFGFDVLEIDGHDYLEIKNAFKRFNNQKQKKPICILLKTIKGKGITFMENKGEWHSKVIDNNFYKQSLELLKN